METTVFFLTRRLLAYCIKMLEHHAHKHHTIQDITIFLKPEHDQFHPVNDRLVITFANSKKQYRGKRV